MKAKKGVRQEARGEALARRAAMVTALRREIARIADGVTFGAKLGGGVEVIFTSFAKFREHERRAALVALPAPWFTEWT